MKLQDMRIGVLFLMSCFTSVAFADEASTVKVPIQKSAMESYVKELSANSGCLEFVYSGSAPLMLMVNNRDLPNIKPGDGRKVALGSVVQIYEHHSGLVLYPLPAPYEKRGFWVVKYSDTRSFGENSILEETGILIIGPYGNGIAMGENVHLISPDLEAAEKILDGK